MDNEKDPLEVEAIEATKDIVVPGEDASENEAEEFASKLVRRAASLSGVKIERGVFLRTTLKKYAPEIDADLAVDSTPIAAGIRASQLDAIARSVIDFETKKCAGLSFLAGIPGGVALVGTVPADLAQYFAHVMRIEQKLAYLYGWQSFLDDSNEIDDETIMELVVLMGVMMEVGGAAASITKFATNVAQKGVAKTIQRQALTKTTFYPVMKSVLRVLGVQLTKETFAKTVSKVVPVVGGLVSGGITYASFKPSAERLRKYLRALPTSGIDTSIPEEMPKSHLDTAIGNASDAAGDIALVTKEKAKIVGSALADSAQNAGTTISEGAQATASLLVDGAKSAGELLGSLKKRSGSRFQRKNQEGADDTNL